MLCELHIENIAVIERADIEFEPGLNVLTGETGAGKSIIIDSIEAVLGGRAGRSLVRTGSERALITAVFTGNGADEDAWLEAHELEPEDELILQRRLSADGKGSCRISGLPFPAATVRELGALLLDIHGQNDGRQLMDEARHLEYLDRFADTDTALYREVFDSLRDTEREIAALTLDESEKLRLTEELKYRIEELTEARLRPGEEDELETRRELLRNAGRLTDAVDGAYSAIYADDASALSQLGIAGDMLQRAAETDPALAALESAAADALYTLEDIAEQLRDYRQGLDFSPDEYDAIELRLQELGRLGRKYSGDESEMLQKLEDAKIRLDEIEYAGDMLVKLERLASEKRALVEQRAGELTARRREAAERLETRIVDELRGLSMPSVRFTVEFEPKSPDTTGADAVRFLMSANAGEVPGRISKIASGGELSRIMLAMKNVFAERDPAGTLIFDEIDAGVSGIAAQRVAEKLGTLSRHRQVLCVTHLPQIAAMADTHFVIEKAERGGRTFTEVRALDREGRKQELARLLGGENVTINTLVSAGEQLDAAANFRSRRSGVEV